MFTTQYNAITTTGAALGALGTGLDYLVNDFPFDEDCTIRNWRVVGTVWRAAKTQAIAIMAVVPDDMVVAFKAADWGVGDTWKKYEKFLWFTQRFSFGSPFTSGKMEKDFDFKPSTMRRIQKDYTLLSLLYLEDVASLNTAYVLSCQSWYDIKSNESP